MDDLEKITQQIDMMMLENPHFFLGNTYLKTGGRLLLMDLLINFNRLEVNFKRLVTYKEIKTFRDMVKTLPLSQLITNDEIINHFDLDLKNLISKVEVNLFIRNLIAHSIPTLIDEKFIVFFSHDIIEAKNNRNLLMNSKYKYKNTERSKKILSSQLSIYDSGYSVMRFNDLIRVNELLTYVNERVEKIVNDL